MISVIDYIRYFTELISNEWHEKVNDKDMEEGFERPSFFIDVIDSTSDDTCKNVLIETHRLIIYYFAEERKTGFLDLLKKQRRMKELLLEPIVIEDVTTEAEEIEYRIIKGDMVLQVELSVTSYQEIIKPDDAEYITDLSVSQS